MQPRKLLLLLLAPVILLSCTGNKEKSENPETMKFYIGTYSRDNSEGIYQASIGKDGLFSLPEVAASAENASFLQRSEDGTFLFAVNENISGTLSAFRIENDSLVPYLVSEPLGMHPCHLTVNTEGDIAVSNYSSGSIALLSIAREKELVINDTLVFKGKGEHNRQDAPHAHSSAFLDASTLVTADLGTDKLWINKITKNDESQTLLTPVRSVELQPQSGPRHMVVHPEGNFMFVVNELNSTVSVYQIKHGALSLLQTITTLPESFKGENLCADIHMDRSGKFLYASNRGHQSLVIYAFNAQTGNLEIVGWENVKGDWPRNFAITPDNRFVVVANERSGNIVSFTRDTLSGTLEYADQKKVPAPVCIRF